MQGPIATVTTPRSSAASQDVPPPPNQTSLHPQHTALQQLLQGTLFFDSMLAAALLVCTHTATGVHFLAAQDQHPYLCVLGCTGTFVQGFRKTLDESSVGQLFAGAARPTFGSEVAHSHFIWVTSRRIHRPVLPPCAATSCCQVRASSPALLLLWFAFHRCSTAPELATLVVSALDSTNSPSRPLQCLGEGWLGSRPAAVRVKSDHQHHVPACSAQSVQLAHCSSAADQQQLVPSE